MRTNVRPLLWMDYLKKRLQKYERYLVVAEPNPLLDPMRGRDPYRAQFNAQPTKAAF